MRLSLLLLVCVTIFSCNNEKPASILNTDILTKQIFKINTARDTVIKTDKGALLKISKNCFTGGGGVVELEVKEAYTFDDIMKAGLTTESNGEVLSSDGMIYINAVDKKISITNPIKVSLPTAGYEVEMEIYKGEEKDGSINWVDPKPIVDSMPNYIKSGKAVFQANCGTCHALDKSLTGPALFGVEHRGPWNNRKALFDFTRNPIPYISTSEYVSCQVAGYGGQIMPSYPQLSDEVLSAVYDYIKYEEIKRGLTFYNDACADSCRRYDSALQVVKAQKMERGKLVSDNGKMSEVYYEPPVVSQGNNSYLGTTSGVQNNYVDMENIPAEYYQFSIFAFGWYNVDRLLKEDDKLKESVLFVNLQGNVKSHVTIYLAIPSMKVFSEAGKTDNPAEFAFLTKDGILPLPQGEKAFIIAVSENEDGVLFAHHEFTISHSQKIAIEVKPSTKEQVYQLFDSFKLPDVSIKIDSSKNATEIRNLDKEIRAFEADISKLKPKACDCLCQTSSNPGDSISLSAQ